jgi:hypothetical protein
MSADQPLKMPPGSSNPGGPRHPDPNDIVLFAMQLLSSEEAHAIAGHIERCAECREELGRVLADIAACAIAVDLEAPPAMARQRLLNQVAREKKVVPIAQQQKLPQAQSQAPANIAAFGRTGSVLTAEERPAKRSSRSIVAWSGWAVVAGLAVAVSYLYGNHKALNNTIAAQSGQIQRLNTDAASAHQLMDALTDPRAVRVTLTSKPLPKAGPIGGVTYNRDKGTLVFLASELDPLQMYKTYELWIIPQDGSAPIPAGTFHPDDQGNASVIMPDLPKGISAKAFGVTIEPEGGSQTPTLPIIMVGT